MCDFSKLETSAFYPCHDCPESGLFDGALGDARVCDLTELRRGLPSVGNIEDQLRNLPTGIVQTGRILTRPDLAQTDYRRAVQLGCSKRLDDTSGQIFLVEINRT